MFVYVNVLFDFLNLKEKKFLICVKLVNIRFCEKYYLALVKRKWDQLLPGCQKCFKFPLVVQQHEPVPYTSFLNIFNMRAFACNDRHFSFTIQYLESHEVCTSRESVDHIKWRNYGQYLSFILANRLQQSYSSWLSLSGQIVSLCFTVRKLRRSKRQKPQTIQRLNRRRRTVNEEGKTLLISPACSIAVTSPTPPALTKWSELTYSTHVNGHLNASFPFWWHFRILGQNPYVLNASWS